MLPGITRDCILTLARELDIPVVLEAMPREALYIADELFFTGTAAEVSPIRSVDRIPVGNGKPGPVARRLQEAFLGLAKGSALIPLWLADTGPTPMAKDVIPTRHKGRRRSGMKPRTLFEKIWDLHVVPRGDDRADGGDARTFFTSTCTSFTK
jgi:hypothetical protein